MTQHLDEQDPAQKLLREGIEASKLGRSDEAIASWLQAVKLHPVFPQAHYLLGAELAQVGRYGDAVVHFTQTVDQAPELVSARVQLALLWLTLQSPPQSELAARPLLELPSDSAYHHFGVALTSLSQGEQAKAVQALRTAQTCALDNAPLGADMNMLLNALLAQAGQSEGAPPAATPANAGEIDHEVAISVYSGRRT